MEKKTYAVFQDYGVFNLYDVETENHVKNVLCPEDIDGFEVERQWFMQWCAENNVEPIFDN